MNLNISGQHVHYEVVGESRQPAGGGDVLILHGWGGSSRSLRPLAQTLGSSLRCSLPDLPGFGRSGNPPPTWGIAEYVHCIRDFIARAGLVTPVSVIGHSFGGAITLSLAAQYPELIAKIVVCAPSWHRHASLHSAPRRVSAMLHHFPLVRRVLYRVLFPQSDLMKYPHLEQNFKKIVREDLTDIVKQIRQNTLIIWGREDTYVPVTDALLLHEYIPHSILRVYPGMRHDLPLAHSELITEPIHVFLTTITRS